MGVRNLLVERRVDRRDIWHVEGALVVVELHSPGRGGVAGVIRVPPRGGGHADIEGGVLGLQKTTPAQIFTQARTQQLTPWSTCWQPASQEEARGKVAACQIGQQDGSPSCPGTCAPYSPRSTPRMCCRAGGQSHRQERWRKAFSC